MQKVKDVLKQVQQAKSSTSTEVENMNEKEVQKNIKRLDELLQPTADFRIKKLANFQILAGKHQFLLDKKNELDKFLVSSDGTKEKIILKNASGFEMEVSNTQVVEEVVQVMQNKLNQFIEHSEKDILNYHI